MNCTKMACYLLLLGENERKYLASQKKLPLIYQIKLFANDKSFNFQIDETWKHKLVNGFR